jgi:hypothetical protein
MTSQVSRQTSPFPFQFEDRLCNVLPYQGYRIPQAATICENDLYMYTKAYHIVINNYLKNGGNFNNLC